LIATQKDPHRNAREGASRKEKGQPNRTGSAVGKDLEMGIVFGGKRMAKKRGEVHSLSIKLHKKKTQHPLGTFKS